MLKALRAGGVALLFLAAGARGDEAGAGAQAARIAAAGHSLEWNHVPAGESERFGHAETLIHVPLASVRAVVLDYGRYGQLVPDTGMKAHVVAKDAAGTDVVLTVPVLKGMVTLSAVERFGPPRAVGPGVERIEGAFVRGNVKRFHPIFTLRAVDASFTVLEFDLLVTPQFYAPQFAIDEELRDAANDLVQGMHDRAQGTPAWAPWTKAP